MTPAALVRRIGAGSVALALAAVAYAALLLFHPIPEAGPVLHGLAHALDRWNVVHIVQLAFIGVMGAGILWLVRHRSGRTATTARVAAVLFVLLYGAYEAWTGIGTGALVDAAHHLPASGGETATAIVQGHWESALLGNVSVGAIAGSTSWLVATVATGLVVRREGGPRGAVVCLIASGLLFAPTHVPPFGPIAMLLFAAAVVWLSGDGRKTR
jgi:hypothetical protein